MCLLLAIRDLANQQPAIRELFTRPWDRRITTSLVCPLNLSPPKVSLNDITELQAHIRHPVTHRKLLIPNATQRAK